MKRLWLITIACLLLIQALLTACSSNADLEQGAEADNENEFQQESAELPAAEDLQIDGSITDGEWQDAEVFSFEDGSELFLKVNDDDLFLAIRAADDRMIAGNVFLESDGQISVLHTSAALGTALYEVDGDIYQKIRDFDWCCRSRADNQGSRKAREDFFTESGWLSINSFLGATNELEYQIKLMEGPTLLAVNFIYADGDDEKWVWPVGLQDGVAQPTAGGFPDLLMFSIDDWISVEELR